MGEAKRRLQQGLPPRKALASKDNASNIISWLPITDSQRDMFFEITKKGAWIGIAFLVVFWLVVRIIGPMLGWWIPADIH